MSRDTFHLIRKVKRLLNETGMVGISYFNHRKRKVSKISAGGRLRKNNQALSYLRSRVLGTRVALASLEVKEADVVEHKTIMWNKSSNKEAMFPLMVFHFVLPANEAPTVEQTWSNGGKRKS